MIVLREVGINPGDTIITQDTTLLFISVRNRIFNTGLFNSVKVSLKDLSDRNVLFIHLIERFYTYPIPIAELADRNFNEWWQQRGHDIRRINIGIYLIQKNIRGKNETLKLKLQVGFTKKAEIFYTIPYLDKKKKFGVNYAFSYIFSKYIAYKIDDYRLKFAHLPEHAIKRFYTGPQFIYRNKYYSFQLLRIQWHKEIINDSILALNQEYLGNGSKVRSNLVFSYTYIRDKRNIQFYPTKGNYFDVEVFASVLTSNYRNIAGFRSEFDYYKNYSEKVSSAHGVIFRVSLPTNQAFFDQKGLGYLNDFIRGYEKYVINGQHYYLTKHSYRYKISSGSVGFSKSDKSKFKTLPVSIYFSANLDAGMLILPKTRTNILHNRLLYGGGIGLDIAGFYDLVLRTEVSINHFKEIGLYFHFQAPIGPKKL